MKGDWSSEEIEEYMKIRIRELGPIYAGEGIPVDNPKLRLKYLFERILDISKEEMETIKQTIDINNKPELLGLLEKMTLKKFY